MDSVSILRQLANIISASVEVIDTNCMQRGIRYPSLDDLDNTSLPMDAVIRRESQIIIAACSQLSATVNLPSLELNNLAMSVSLSLMKFLFSDTDLEMSVSRPILFACRCLRKHSRDPS